MDTVKILKVRIHGTPGMRRYRFMGLDSKTERNRCFLLPGGEKVADDRMRANGANGWIK
jgi:hypothetical protein